MSTHVLTKMNQNLFHVAESQLYSERAFFEQQQHQQQEQHQQQQQFQESQYYAQVNQLLSC